MAKILLGKDPIKNPMLFSTPVENLFISELLPSAPGDFVKVYMLGLMNAQYGLAQDYQTTANVLKLSLEDIENAWAYWEEKGAVRQVYDAAVHAYRIQFISQLDELYGGSTASEEKYSAEAAATVENNENAGNSVTEGSKVTAPLPPKERSASPDDESARLQDLEIAALYEQLQEAKGGSISQMDASRIRDAINIYEITPDVYSYAIKYCKDLDNYNVKYITNVALRWKEEGCKDIVQVKELLDKESKRNSEFNRIFQAVGYHRQWTPADREMMTTWLDDWQFSMKEILDACSKTAGMREPDLRYVNRILENKMKEAGGINTRKDSDSNRSSGRSSSGGDSYRHSVSRKVLGDYYEYLRNEAELEYQNHRSTARKEIPGMANLLTLEDELNKAIMVSFSFSPKAKEERKVQIQKINDLDAQKRKLLQQNGYPQDYLDKRFKCEKCKDSGITDKGEFCTCTKDRVEEAYRWNLKRGK